jgi:maltooligosyltrehalose trehalohydrolase
MQHAFVLRGRVDRTGRRRGAPVPHSDGNRFVAFAQNHDHVGNRAIGDRLAHQAGVERAMVAAALVAFSPFTPLLFQGEEWAASSPFCFFAEFTDPQLVEAVRNGRKDEFAAFVGAEQVPDPTAVDTFLASRLDWDELTRPAHARVRTWHRDLLALRRQWSELTDGRRDFVAIDFVTDDVLVVRRGRLTLIAVVAEVGATLPAEAPILMSSRPVEPGARTVKGPIALVLRTA